jgi:hypothetical protein
VRLVAQGFAQDALEPLMEVVYPALPLFVEKFVVEMSVADKNVIYKGVWKTSGTPGHTGLRGR